MGSRYSLVATSSRSCLSIELDEIKSQTTAPDSNKPKSSPFAHSLVAVDKGGETVVVELAHRCVRVCTLGLENAKKGDLSIQFSL